MDFRKFEDEKQRYLREQLRVVYGSVNVVGTGTMKIITPDLSFGCIRFMEEPNLTAGYRIKSLSTSTRRYEEVNPAVSYAGTWVSAADSQASSGAWKYSNVTGNYALFSFTGTSASLISSQGPNRGYVRIYLDGAYIQDVDLYASAYSYKNKVYTASGLTDGPHNIRAEVLGSKNPASSDYYVIVDAFDVEESTLASVDLSVVKYGMDSKGLYSSVQFRIQAEASGSFEAVIYYQLQGRSHFIYEQQSEWS